MNEERHRSNIGAIGDSRVYLRVFEEKANGANARFLFAAARNRRRNANIGRMKGRKIKQHAILRSLNKNATAVHDSLKIAL
ncbi:hypothetical protein L596_007749 [Steinernema carpocapsae]|uniref:Uncharacterized protein n=1 Tax=Steinernema carpocapsae TaxID=34508 RepID=A0A4U5PAG6_STECR|nr:hypothetical protein L596_007749 [Steinernema carpocapsae]